LKDCRQHHNAIDAHLAELERRWGRITGCRVVVKGPGPRHRQGGLYDVHIRLALPDGREVNVTRTPPADERHSDLTFAVNDAFKHARRQLQDEVRQMQGHTKSHHDSATDHPPVRSIDNVQTNFDTNRWKRYFESGTAARYRTGKRLTFQASALSRRRFDTCLFFGKCAPRG
jgi:sigma 54 modulation/S30EA-like ribosomal protein